MSEIVMSSILGTMSQVQSALSLAWGDKVTAIRLPLVPIHPFTETNLYLKGAYGTVLQSLLQCWLHLKWHKGTLPKFALIPPSIPRFRKPWLWESQNATRIPCRAAHLALCKHSPLSLVLWVDATVWWSCLAPSQIPCLELRHLR